jgi:hypothetical protein
MKKASVKAAHRISDAPLVFLCLVLQFVHNLEVYYKVRAVVSPFGRKRSGREGEALSAEKPKTKKDGENTV